MHNITNASGIITSPVTPEGEYSPFLHHIWYITGTPGTRLLLYFTKIDVEEQVTLDV